MKIFVDDLRPTRIHVIGKIAVDAEHPAAGPALCFRVEMNDLRHRVDTGIRSPGTYCFDRLVCNFRQCLLDGGLNADTTPLALPAIISRAVVLDTEGYTHDSKNISAGMQNSGRRADGGRGNDFIGRRFYLSR